MSKCPYCTKREGKLPVACELGAVDICKKCAIAHQKRLGIKQECIDKLDDKTDEKFIRIELNQKQAEFLKNMMFKKVRNTEEEKMQKSIFEQITEEEGY